MPVISTNTFFFLLFLLIDFTSSSEDEFVFNGFNSTILRLDGVSSITSNGLLELTNSTAPVKGHAFHQAPLRFKTAPNEALSFSTTFAFCILPESSNLTGHGIAFLISPTKDLSAALAIEYMGLFNQYNNGNSSNHIFAVELDTNLSLEFQDIDNNHVGIDINSLISNVSRTAGYYEDTTGSFRSLSLASGQPIQVWIDFDGKGTQLNVTIAPLRAPKPSRPLLSSALDLASLVLDSMYVGFSSANGPFHTRHYILGWSFKMNGAAEQLNYAKLPSLPAETGVDSGILVWWLPIVLCSFVLSVVVATLLLVKRKMAYDELLEDWEIEYGPHRFSYRDLFQATKGFKESELLGTGGFGRVYRGVLPASKIEIAVKKVSHGSNQGIKEFVAEIFSLGHLRHRNLVQLLGYCRRRGELLLVYDFMPNGSLDNFLYDRAKPALNWAQRFRIIKGVASGLLYLHEDWEQVVIHRDIKASNVLLDGELNGRVGDFGLARLYDRESDPQTTRVVGTMGYLAPELAVIGKATTATDVFAFGAFLLEVVCGRRPVERCAGDKELVLLDWVLESWHRGSVIETTDPRLGDDYNVHEVELVLKLSLLCSHPFAESRPSMRQVMQILEGDVQFCERLLSSSSSFRTLSWNRSFGFEDHVMSFTSSRIHDSDVSGH